jgi:hypothetical protein
MLLDHLERAAGSRRHITVVLPRVTPDWSPYDEGGDVAGVLDHVPPDGR